MRNLIVVSGMVFTALVSTAGVPNPTWGRISRTMERMARSTAEHPETVRILFYGQSIVSQPWNRDFLVPELKKRYPTVKFEIANRAIGGYQSPVLVKTAEHDLYPFYPDLLFFHVYGPTDRYEDIVRRTRERTTADIVLWTSHLRADEGETPEKIQGQIDNPDERTRAIRAIAEKYGCMLIDLRPKWCKMLLEKGIKAGDLLRDVIHMKPETLPIYAGMIAEDLFAGGAAEANPAAGTVRTEPAALKLAFAGNRVVAVSDGATGAEYDVFLDGRNVNDCEEMWAMTRVSNGPSKRSWNPVIDRVDRGLTPPVRERWTLTFLPGGKDDGSMVPFKLAGSVTGEDGEGRSDERFVSKSGRIVIEPENWMGKFWWGYHKTKPEAGFTATWETVPMATSPFRPGAKGERTVLVQGCSNGRHVLELRPKAAGPLGFSAFEIHAPKAQGKPHEGDTVHAFDRDVYVHDPNYDKTKIPPYTLEDPLTFLDGRKVTKENWPERRREILDLFAKEMYGAEPPAPEAVVTELVDEKNDAVAGYGIRRQYRMWFKADKSGPCLNWIVWIPRHAKKPVPVVSFLNYRGNAELVTDKDIPLMTAWVRDGAPLTKNSRATEAIRGRMQDPSNATVLPIGTILARGYAVMSACYCEVSPDPTHLEPEPEYRQSTFAYTGVFSLWGPRDPARTDNVTALGAWGWALSRGLDLAERIPEIDAKRAVVTGCSRLGKAAFMAAARDERFAVCVPNQTGGGGVPLAKRDYGENVSTENRSFTHWYCRAYAKYAKDPHRTLPFDQHLFVACIAPRALLVEGFDNRWFDTEGEYLSVKAASPVWELLTGSGMPKVDWPDDYDTSAIGARLGYVHRTEAHGISAQDWQWTLDFADRAFGK